jgi:hypothetical protein
MEWNSRTKKEREEGKKEPHKGRRERKALVGTQGEHSSTS